MEVFIGVILFIGAFALGQTTADQNAVEKQPRLGGEHAVAFSADGFVHQDCRFRVNGPVQRDLTLPYSHQ